MYVNRSKSAAIINLSRAMAVRSFQCGTCFVSVETDLCTLYSVYISPNSGIEVFAESLDELRLAVQTSSKELVIAGDFNAKNTYWGGERTDGRGTLLLEWAYALNLNVLNDGTLPTLVRTNGTSYIDLTMATEGMMVPDPVWQVLAEESLSDHRYVLAKFYSRDSSQVHSSHYSSQYSSQYRWIYGATDQKKLIEYFKQGISPDTLPDARTCT